MCIVIFRLFRGTGSFGGKPVLGPSILTSADSADFYKVYGHGSGPIAAPGCAHFKPPVGFAQIGPIAGVRSLSPRNGPRPSEEPQAEHKPPEECAVAEPLVGSGLSAEITDTSLNSTRQLYSFKWQLLCVVVYTEGRTQYTSLLAQCWSFGLSLSVL